MFFRYDVTASDIMSKDYYVFHEYDTVSKIKDLGILNKNSEIFITDTNKEIKGTVSTKDIRYLLLHLDVNNNEKIYLKDIMKSCIISVSPETPLDKCKDIMIENHIDNLPVIKDKKTKGVINKDQILKFFYTRLRKLSKICTHILNNIQEAICVIDKEGRVIVWNDNAEKLYNISKKDILGKKLNKFFPNAIDIKVLKTRNIVRNIYHSPKKGSHIIISAAPIF